ncbi:MULTISPECIES: hypothetical protein [unclassified Paraburkholderia]|nr:MULTISPECIES: hypothetical protein [unclassified Paraburkholderia]
MIVRPDYYVFGAARTPEEVNALIAKLIANMDLAQADDACEAQQSTMV